MAKQVTIDIPETKENYAVVLQSGSSFGAVLEKGDTIGELRAAYRDVYKRANNPASIFPVEVIEDDKGKRSKGRVLVDIIY